jgi:hypothetical protein
MIFSTLQVISPITTSPKSIIKPTVINVQLKKINKNTLIKGVET